MQSIHVPGRTSEAELTDRLRSWFTKNLPSVAADLYTMGGLLPPDLRRVAYLRSLAPIAIRRVRRRRAQEIIALMPEAAQATFREMEQEGAVFEADEDGLIHVITKKKIA